MGIFRLTAGKFRRFEGGTLTAYEAPCLVDLNEEEQVRLGHRIKPVGRAPVPCPDPVAAPEPEALSGPRTPDLPDAARHTPEGEFDGLTPRGDDEAPQSDDEPLATGGVPVFTASETPRKTFTELRQVVANIGEPSVVRDMLEVEAATRKRSTVMTWLEAAYDRMVEADDQALEDAESKGSGSGKGEGK